MWRAAALRAGGATLVGSSLFGDGEAARACGIVGVVGHSPDAKDILLDGLAILQNRGYDSAGMATMRRADGGGACDVAVTKYASRGSTADSVALVRAEAEKHAAHTIGIAHTRWATHGGKTDENAHPHFDCRDRVGVVHNGVIMNADALRDELEARGVVFRSQTDTEVIAQLIGERLEEEAGLSLVDATQKALARCEGTWGVCALERSDASSVVVACNGSPMNIGLAKDRTFIATARSASSAGETTLDIRRAEVAPDLELRKSPAPYKHWMEREIREQPEAIARALAFGGRLGEDKVFLGGLDRQRDRMRDIEHVLLVGCGTSLNASAYGARLMRDLGAFDTAQAMDASEVGVHDIPPKSSGVIAVSQSGETKDVLRTVKKAMDADVAALSIVNTVGSLIARTTKLGVYLNAGRENAVASTKAFTTQVTVLALITCWFHQLRAADAAADGKKAHYSEKFKELMVALQRLPISFGMGLRLQDQCRVVAERLKTADHLFILGKGYGEPIASEGALKIKECTYDMTKRTPIIMLILDDEHAAMMRTAAEEVKARHADVIVITDDAALAHGVDADPIVIPRNGKLTALGAVLPLQFIAYELALLRGVNPDFPRHLAKSVTVD
ncbi:glutamine-fructose-6-phosphate transaminase [Aureococcus anophagefferens]|nr:glutamine-fructose-6-phosphate transaminase [Aureococcus anophagefferens]